MLIAGIIVLGIGALFCFMGIVFWLVGQSPCTGQTDGTVVGFCRSAQSFNKGAFDKMCTAPCRQDIGIRTWYPVLEYMVKGVLYRRAAPVAHDCATIQKLLGQPRIIYYDPGRPERASLSKYNVFRILSTVFIAVGAVLVLTGSILLLVR